MNYPVSSHTDLNMTLDEIIRAMQEGMADSRHASELLIIIHDLRDELTKFKTDILLCQKILGLQEGELVSPTLQSIVRDLKEQENLGFAY